MNSKTASTPSVCISNDNAFYVATLRDLKPMEEIAPDKSAAWRKLDVAILHKLILEKHLGIDEAALTAQTNVEYIKDIAQRHLWQWTGWMKVIVRACFL